MNKHEENRENDVKENEKSGEMRGFATPKQGMRGKKQGMRGPKQGMRGTPKKSASPVDALRKTRPNPQHKKWMETKNTTLFEQLLLPKLLPCRFISTFIYTQREKMV